MISKFLSMLMSMAVVVGCGTTVSANESQDANNYFYNVCDEETDALENDIKEVPIPKQAKAKAITSDEHIGSFSYDVETNTPGRNGSKKPFGTASSYRLECGGNWYNNDNQDDWGIIRINSNLGEKTGWLGLKWQSATYDDKAVDAVGYPHVGKNGFNDNYMYFSSGKVDSSSS